MFSEMDIRSATVFFAAKARAVGVLPLVVMLCPPGREDEGFRRFAIDYLIAVAKAKHEGKRPPALNEWKLRNEEDYAAVGSTH